MPKLSPAELRALIAAEKADALSAMSASKLSEERAAALDYYLGDMSRDMPAPDGRSRAVSTDVADTIEGLMPSLMEIFTAGDEVVRFEPVGPEDVAAAEQETDYVNHVFMQQNPGFFVLYSFIKDALLSKVGIVKVWWDSEELVERETYLDQPDDAFALLVADPCVEIVEHTAHSSLPAAGEASAGQAQAGEAAPFSLSSDMASSPARDTTLHDVTIEIGRKCERAHVEAVAPEEFGISRHARTIREADYAFHDVFRTEAKLIEQGYDKEQIKRLPSYIVAHTIEEISRDTINESTLRRARTTSTRRAGSSASPSTTCAWITRATTRRGFIA